MHQDSWIPTHVASLVLTVVGVGLLTQIAPVPRVVADGGKAAPPVALKVDVDKIEGRGNCTGCHDGKRDRDTKAWEASAHARAMSRLSKRAARKIRRKMGFRRANRDSSCVACHGQPARKGDSLELVDGVTCEMCHGPAKGWIEAHEHTERRAEALAAGWIPPDATYELASNCFDCHLVADARLVDVGGHPKPRAFELVAWSQGEVRHNYNSEKGHSSNEPTAKPRLRKFFVVGCLVDLEYSLRARAKAPEGAYRTHIDARIARLHETLAAIDGKAPTLGIGALRTAIRSLDDAAASKRVGALARSISKARDGTKLAALDGLLPAPADYVGTVHGK